MVPCASHLALEQLAGFALEHFDEFAADDLALLLRIGNTGQVAHELLGGVNVHDLHAEILAEHVHHHLAFVQPQEAVIDEYAGELVADGAMDQRRRHAAVDTAGQAEDDFITTDLGADFLDGLGDIVRHVPVRLAAADLVHEAAKDGFALQRVRDFRVELHGVKMALIVGHAGDRAIVGGCHQPETGRQFDHLVAVAHPHLEHAVAFIGDEISDTVQQRGMAARAHLGIAELAHGAIFHLAAQLRRHGLHAVANAQYRHAGFEHRLRRARRIALHHRIRPAREDDAGGAVVADEIVADIVRIDLGKYPGVTHAARDQLGHLGTEVEDKDFRMHEKQVFRVIR